MVSNVDGNVPIFILDFHVSGMVSDVTPNVRRRKHPLLGADIAE